MKKILLMLGFAFLIMSCANITPQYAKQNAIKSIQKDIEVLTQDGSFIFKNIYYYEDSLLPRLRGTLINNTSKEWSYAEFEIILYDNRGNIIRTNNATSKQPNIVLFKISKNKPINLDERIMDIIDIIETKSINLSKFDIKFKDGTYPTKFIFLMVKPHESNELEYSDKHIKINFSFNENQCGFILKNNTDSPVKIDWNQAAYVDVSGESHKVMHRGVKFIDKERILPSSIIPPSAKLDDVICPVDYVVYLNTSGWSTGKLFPSGPSAKNFIGKSISIFLPIEINGIVKNYLFTFNIINIEI